MKYEGEIFVSTGAFARQDLEDTLQLALSENISRIELSSGARHRSSDLSALLGSIDQTRMKFLVHNYFPVPVRPFVLNLASDDQEMLQKTREHCKFAIDIAAKVDAPFYSVHAGFCIHLKPEDLGQKLQGKEISKEKAKVTFYESVKLLGEYAATKGVTVAIENNVASAFNLREGRNDLLLGVTGDDLEELMQVVNMPNVRLLLDVAHLRVSANSLGFDAIAAIKKIAPWIIACHLSDNDGQTDSNQVLTSQSWFWEPLAKYLKTKPVWILEVYEITPDVIHEQLSLMRSEFGRLRPNLVS